MDYMDQKKQCMKMRIKSGERLTIDIRADGKVNSRRETKSAGWTEKLRRESEGKTQGRKGCRMPRINMCFSSENREYIELMSKCSGMSMGQFVNECVRFHRMNNISRYMRMLEIKEGIKK